MAVEESKQRNLVAAPAPFSTVITPDPFDEIITGTQGADTLRGSFGTQWLYGLGGRDRLFGGEGDDVLDGGGGTDRLDGGAGSDTVLYTVNTTAIRADLGQGRVSFPGQRWSPETLVSIENLYTGSGNDIVFGSSAANTLVLNAGNDVARGRAGDDGIDGGSGNDRLYGDGGDDRLQGGAGRDQLYGGDGDDVLDGGGGTDRLDGGAGSDTVLYAVNTTAVSINLAAGTASFPGQSWSSETLVSIENVVTGSGSDAVIGSRAANVIATGAGDDYINAARGDDTLDGGAGFDTLLGGPGRDRLHGGQDADRLFGGAGDDVLEGGGGADYLDGGAGIDTAVYVSDFNEFGREAFDPGDDPVAVSADLGRGRVGFASAWYDAEVPRYAETLVSIENITTGAGDDVIRGSDGANVIRVGGGANVVYGEGGDDIIVSGFNYSGSTASWYEPETMGSPDNFGDYIDGGDGNDIIFSGGSYRTQTGDFREDTDEALEIVLGGAGDDTLVAGYGDLRFTGGTGADEFRFSDAQTDIAPSQSAFDVYAGQFATITDFDSGEGDRIVIDVADPTSPVFAAGGAAAVGEWGFYQSDGTLGLRYIFAEARLDTNGGETYPLDIDIRFAGASPQVSQADVFFV